VIVELKKICSSKDEINTKNTNKSSENKSHVEEEIQETPGNN
jgi:hypothetical protein